MKHKTSALVEAAIFAAIAIVFNLVFYYVPILGTFVNMVMPLPIAICGTRHGWRWSIMALVVSAALVAMLINPLQALFYVGVFGVMGIVLGECLHRHFKPTRLILVSSLGALAGIVINFLLALYVMGVNPINLFFQAFDEAGPQMAEIMSSVGMDAASVANLQQQVETSAKMMKLILPGSVLLCAPFLALINYWAARKILSKLGEHFEAFPPFSAWSMPRWLVAVYFLGVFGTNYLGFTGQQTSLYYQLAANAWAVSSIFLMLQGLSLVYWFVLLKNKPKAWIRILVVLTFLVPVVSLILTYVGIYDLVVNFRKRMQDKLSA